MYGGVGKGAVNHMMTEGYCTHEKLSMDSREKRQHRGARVGRAWKAWGYFLITDLEGGGHETRGASTLPVKSRYVGTERRQDWDLGPEGLCHAYPADGM